MPYRILVADPIAQEGIALLERAGQVDVKLRQKEAELEKLVGDYDALVVRSETKVTAPIIRAGKKLQVIGRAGVGVDTIDVDAATAQGVIVVNAPAGNTISTAEHTLALMLALARNLPQAHASLKAGEWSRSQFTGVELRHKVLGIFGLGRVGSEVARRALAFQMRVLGHDPFVSEALAQQLGVQLASLEELLRQADFITVHTPLSVDTRGLLGERELRLVKPTVRLLNVARGGIIDEAALVQALDEGRVAGAALDVFSQEPPPAGHPLVGHPKVIVTPHLGASTAEAQTSVATDVAEQVVDVLQGRPARYAVNAPFVPPEAMAALGPFVPLCQALGSLARQLAEGQPSAVAIHYQGEVAAHPTVVLRAAVLQGLLEGSSEQRVTVTNASLIAQAHGLRLSEHTEPTAEAYNSLITVEVAATGGTCTVAGTIFQGKSHLVRVDSYWVDLVPTGGYWLFSHHLDRPGMIGNVGTVCGQHDINISSMQVGRERPRGRAMMIVGLDEPIGEEQLAKIRAIPNVYNAKLVKL
ncbi:MAG: phosphoglycerate dehydrogenase [Chloroflexi bacterium]|nr:phosphoglycerate dehydrogenase [Chloroflexota bacterium]